MFPGCGVALLPARPVDLRAQGEGVVEYPGKVACPSGRRCSTRNAVWCHSHPGFKSQRYRHCRPAPLGPGGFVMPTWRVGGLLPRQISGRRAACPPASRPRCELRSARRLEARPGPAGLAAASNRSGLVAVSGSPWPGRRPPVLRFEARPCAPGPPAPSTPAVPGVLTCGLACRLDVQLWLSISNSARNSSVSHSNFEFASLELQRFCGMSKNDRDKLCGIFGWRWSRCCPRAPQPGPPQSTGAAAWSSGPFDVCCYKRRQSEVFFVWISDPLLQTSSI